MKKFWLYILAAAALCACSHEASLENGSVKVLDGPWQVSRAGGPESVTTTVPATVAGALYSSGFYGADLLESTNYRNADKSIFDDQWVWQTEFEASVSGGQHSVLTFEGIGYRADIFLNDKQIASSDTAFGVFRNHSFDVTGLLKRHNRLEARVRRAQKGDLNIGFVDWNPRPLDESMGIVRPVTLHTTGTVVIEDVFVIPDLDVTTLAQADIRVRVKLRNTEGKPVKSELTVNLQDAGGCTLPVDLAPFEKRTVTITPEEAPMLHLENPRVWWPHDLGTPELYNMEVSATAGGKISDKHSATFGVRRVESRLVGKNYRQFTINGKDILIKGAGWTDDIFLLDTPGSLERQVRYVKDMNLNCIRFENIWGKDDTIYDLCDREGVLALVGWSCQWEWEDYCGLPEVGHFGCINGREAEDLAVDYFRDQVVRLHNHASIIGWMTGSDRIPNPDLEARYMEIYSEEEYRPYICSAKNMESTVTGWSGTKMEGPYDYVAPDYWYFDKSAGGAFGFNTETGIGANIPQIESLRRMIPEGSLWPLSEEWDYHCTASSSVMNNVKVLANAVGKLYGEPAGLEDFVKKAHALDYNGTRAMFEAFRVGMPGTTGIVQWMLNSAWPSVYWQLYDWYGVPTAAYYGTKKACEPDQLIFNYRDRKVYAVSENPEGRELVATLQLFDPMGNQIGIEKRTVKTGYRTVAPVFDLRRYDGRPHYVALALTTPDGGAVADNFYALGRKDNVYDFARTTWYDTPITSWTDLRFVFQGPAAGIAVTSAPSADGCSVTVENRSKAVAPMVILKAYDAEGRLAVPVFWEDNFFALLPGQTRTVACRSDIPDLRIEVAE
ncbi:MAG: glycoside hydrolase family 2 [Bacteroidales bacterium]|nr:glycoside hydrolase family 2 [Bacteroidales bacterium]